jgi:predicted house-cleaning noncanonical NTP pyrophosphatase (MazG superfamily)
MSNSENSAQVKELSDRINTLKTKLLDEFFEYLDSENKAYDPDNMNKIENEILELETRLQEAKPPETVTPEKSSSESEK